MDFSSQRNLRTGVSGVSAMAAIDIHALEKNAAILQSL